MDLLKTFLILSIAFRGRSELLLVQNFYIIAYSFSIFLLLQVFIFYLSQFLILNQSTKKLNL